MVKILFNKKIPWSDFAKALLKIFAVLLFIHIPRMILHFVFVNDILDNVLYYVSLYPTFLGIAAVVVADQDQHEKTKIFQSHFAVPPTQEKEKSTSFEVLLFW